MDNNSSVHIRTSQQVVVKPYKVGINCQTLLFQKLCITLHAIKQFRATQQTAHFQTILGIDVDGCLERQDGCNAEF